MNQPQPTQTLEDAAFESDEECKRLLDIEVAKYARSHPAKPPPPHAMCWATIATEIRRLYAQGMSPKAIRKMLGIGLPPVTRALKGQKKGTIRVQDKDRDASMRAAWAAGASFGDIATDWETSVYRVRAVCTGNHGSYARAKKYSEIE